MVAPASSTGYTVLARRFRPQAFGEVVGQEHIAQALRNAIRANRVAHAYLFTGARGVGKTSSARILAKALNCPQAIDGDPCNECEICRGISAGNDVDVIEIDGASNRGIEDIRQLRANVNVKSMRTRYKVYIIDEVHMLTKEAFNALLKTLEEPPPGVKFVFCTTEPNKVPDTILSRCQRFDFGTIATGSIKQRLEQIAIAEGVQVDDAAFDLVSRRAAGSMRDSQSIFDQLLAFGEKHITAIDVHRLLGTASDDRLIAIVDTLVGRSPGGALQALHAAIDSGAQLGELMDQILFYLRDLMILAAGANELDLLAVSSNAKAALTAQAKKWGIQTILAAMQILSDTKSRMQRVTYGRALAELGLVRVALLENMQSLDGLIDQLKAAETMTALPGPTSSSDEKKNDIADGHEPQMLVAASSQPDSAAYVSPSIAPHAVTEVAPSPTEPPIASYAPAPIVESAAAAPVIVEPQVSVPQQEPARAQPAAVPKSPVPVASSPVVEAPSSDLSDDDILAQFGAPPDDEFFDEGSVAPQRAAIAPARSAQAKPAPGPVAPSAPTSKAAPAAVEPAMPEPVFAAVSMDDMPPAFEFWQRITAEITDMLKSHAKAVTRASYPGPGRLEIALPLKSVFSRRYVEKVEVIRRLEDIAARLSNRMIKISVTSCDDDPEVAIARTSDGKRPVKQRVYKPEEDAFVAHVMNVFSAQVVKVDPILGASMSQSET